METEVFVRLGIFFGIFGLMAVLETVFPRRKRVYSRKERWPANFAISLISTLIGRYSLPFTALTAAEFAKDNGLGLFNVESIEPWLAVLFSVVFLDLVVYWQHRIFHLIPILWRFHIVHHIDEDLDVSSGARFHPIEICLSLVIKIFVILSLGVPVLAVLIFEVILNAMAMFNHANVRIPTSIDLVLRKIVVTPDFHRIHHSVRGNEHRSNYGFNFSLWDYLFGSYVSEPEEGQDNFKIGLDGYHTPKKSRNILYMLSMPLRRQL